MTLTRNEKRQALKQADRRVLTVENLHAQNERVSLPEPLWNGRRQVGTGQYICSLYRGPQTGRMFATFDSIWEDHNHPGCCIGSYTEELDESRFLAYCDMLNVEPSVEPTEA